MLSNKIFYKLSWVVLLYFLVLSSYNLFFSEESIINYLDIKQKIIAEQKLITEQELINNSLYSEVDSLKNGYSAIEERARNDLGLIKPGETFYRIIDTTT